MFCYIETAQGNNSFLTWKILSEKNELFPTAVSFNTDDIYSLIHFKEIIKKLSSE